MRTQFNLLTSNAKLEKGSGGKYLLAGLALAPAKRGGHEVCPARTDACTASCNLWFSGRTVTGLYREAAARRTRLLFESRSDFMMMLGLDMEKLQSKAKRLGMTPLVRLNVSSDLDWIDFIKHFPGIRMFDYTKVRSRALGSLPDNYSLTLSWHENMRHNTGRAMLDRGRNIAVVFNVEYNPQHNKLGRLPDSWRIGGREWPVVDGDRHDFRIPEEDGRGVIVGLRLKGTTLSKERAVKRGFAVTP